MPTYKVVCFYEITDIPQKQYMTEQRHAIQNALPHVETELADSTDSRLAVYTTNPSRMPCLIIFKDDARMMIKHAKRPHPEIINWVRAATT